MHPVLSGTSSGAIGFISIPPAMLSPCSWKSAHSPGWPSVMRALPLAPAKHFYRVRVVGLVTTTEKPNASNRS